MQAGHITIIFSIFSFMLKFFLSQHIFTKDNLNFDFNKIIYDGQYWRLLTSIFTFQSVRTNILFVVNSHFVETGCFNNNPADFLLFSFFGILFFWALGIFSSLNFFDTFITRYFIYYCAKKGKGSFTFIAFCISRDIFAWKNGNASLLTILPFFISHLFFFFNDVLGSFFKHKPFLSLPKKVNEALHNFF